MFDYIGIQRFDLALAPVHTGHPLNIREIPPGKAYHPAVMHPQGKLAGARVVDEVVCRQAKVRVPNVRYRLVARRHSHPAVQDHQAGKAARENTLRFQWLVHDALLPTNEDQPNGAAIEPPPAQAVGHLGFELSYPLGSFKFRLHLRGDICPGEDEPFPGHILRHDAHHILHDPVGAVK